MKRPLLLAVLALAGAPWAWAEIEFVGVLVTSHRTLFALGDTTRAVEKGFTSPKLGRHMLPA